MIRLCILLAGYLSLSIADIRYKSVSIIHLGIVAAVSMASVFFTEPIKSSMLHTMLTGAFAGFVLFLILTLTGAIGEADGIMLIITGCVTGYITLLQIFILAVTLLSIYAAGLLLAHKIKIKQEIPFFPFLFLSVLGVTICG